MKFDLTEIIDKKIEGKSPFDLLLILKSIIKKEKHGMTYVSNETKIDKSNLHKILSGERNIRFDTLLLILNAVGLELFCPQLNYVISNNQPERSKREDSHGK